MQAPERAESLSLEVGMRYVFKSTIPWATSKPSSRSKGNLNVVANEQVSIAILNKTIFLVLVYAKSNPKFTLPGPFGNGTPPPDLAI